MPSKQYVCLKRIYYLFICVFLLTITTIVEGCATTSVRNPLPANLEDQVQVTGFENVRSWGDKDSPILDKIAIESIKREIEANGVESLKNPVSFLLVGDKFKGKKLGSGGVLGNIAPTIMELMSVEKPKVMKKESLL